MKKKKLFAKKNKKYYKIKFIIFSFFILFIIYYIYIFNINDKYFIIPTSFLSFYIVPDNKGGEKINNLDKKSLHLSYNEEYNFNIINNDDIMYSIQLTTSDDYLKLLKHRDLILKQPDSIFDTEDIFVSVFDSTIGREYFLLYKNFNSRNLAIDYCKKFAYFLHNCVIVNVQNLN